MLQEERDFYDQSLPELLKHHANRVVLIKGRELVGAFDDEEAALAEGARRFGLDSFLIRRVRKERPDTCIPALALGILGANPTHTSWRTSS